MLEVVFSNPTTLFGLLGRKLIIDMPIPAFRLEFS
jgi:hypothetical protein